MNYDRDEKELQRGETSEYYVHRRILAIFDYLAAQLANAEIDVFVTSHLPRELFDKQRRLLDAWHRIVNDEEL